MGNECCSGRRSFLASFRDYPDGENLKEAIITRDDDRLLTILMRSSKELLRCSMDEDMNTPFLLACIYSFDKIEVLSALLRAGSNPKARNRVGNSAIHLVCSCASATHSALQTIKFLHNNYGVGLDVKNNYGLDALWTAVGRGDLNAYKYLKSFGGDMDWVNDDGETLIFPAIRSGNFELVKFMTEKDKLKLTTMNKSHETPLHLAAKYSSLIFLYIQKSGQVDSSVKDREGRVCTDLLGDAN